MKSLALVAALSLSFATVAHADEQNEARALFKEGNRLLDQGDYVGALDMFKGAYSRWPNVKILLNLGTALRQLGRNVEAAENYEKYLNDSQADPAKKPQVEAILKEISAKLGKLRIEVNEPGARVVIDGRPVGSSPQSFTIRVEPGSHSVVAEKEGYPLAAATVSVAAGEERAVELRLQSSARPVVETPPTPVEKPATTTTTTETSLSLTAQPEVKKTPVYKKWWLWTIVGVAVVGVGLGLGLGLGLSGGPSAPSSHFGTTTVF
jgi:hypothetical protein